MPVLQHCGVQEYGSHLDPEQVTVLLDFIHFDEGWGTATEMPYIFFEEPLFWR